MSDGTAAAAAAAAATFARDAEEARVGSHSLELDCATVADTAAAALAAARLRCRNLRSLLRFRYDDDARVWTEDVEGPASEDAATLPPLRLLPPPPLDEWLLLFVEVEVTVTVPSSSSSSSSAEVAVIVAAAAAGVKSSFTVLRSTCSTASKINPVCRGGDGDETPDPSELEDTPSAGCGMTKHPTLRSASPRRKGSVTPIHAMYSANAENPMRPILPAREPYVAAGREESVGMRTHIRADAVDVGREVEPRTKASEGVIFGVPSSPVPTPSGIAARDGRLEGGDGFACTICCGACCAPAA